MQVQLVQIIYSLLLSRQFWFWSSTLAAGYLAIAPIIGNWNKQATELGFIGSALTLVVGWLTHEYVGYQISEIKVRNRMEYQYSLDETVHVVNRVRAMQHRELQLMMGADTVADFVAQMMDGEVLPAETAEGLPQLTGEKTFFPEEDLALQLATETSSGTLIVAPSGCGKTRLLQQAIMNANQHYQTNVDFQIIDCKGDEAGWLGLERSPQDCLIYDCEEKTDEAYQTLETIKRRLRGSAPQYPTIAVLDEWNNGLSTAEAADELSEGGQKYAKPMKVAGRSIITKGRSKRVYGWVTTHSPKTDVIGMDEATRQSVNIIILARANKLGTIAMVLKNSYKFVEDDLIRQQLSADFQEFMQSEFSKDRPIALTNLGGKWRIITLPFYPDRQPDIKRSALNQTANETASEGLDSNLKEMLDTIIQDNQTHGFDVSFNASITDSLEPHLKIIIEAAKANGGKISARECQRLKGIPRSTTSEQIKGYFKDIERYEIGKVHVDPSDSRRWILWVFNEIE